MPDLKSYLAEKYMSGPKADAILARVGPQKKKRKALTSAPTPSGAVILDDDADWRVEEKDEAEDLAEAVVASDRGFKKRKIAPKDEESGWTTLQEGIKKEESPPPAADEQPVIVDGPSQQPFVGGLVTASQLKKVLPKKRETQTTATAEEIARAQETVYRDATGRKIDTKAARAEAARLKREREEKEAQKMEWGKGLVQREEHEKRKLELQKQQGKGFRHADDADLNEEQKAKELWNDPAAAFLIKKNPKGPRKPEYKGPPPPPNRFGIKPGYRWDGVDRGNGFEKKFFAANNERRRKGAESYQWSVDDM